MHEEVFTTPAGLVGILTVPHEYTARGLPAVVILNSGNMHRVGTGRISVTLARRLAGLGHVVMRFDHSGVGDSAPRRDGMSLDGSRVEEITTVVTAMQDRFGVEGFVLYGLCSGARDAFHAALGDPRIVGLIQIDGFAYRNLRFHLKEFGRRLRDLPAVTGRLFRRLGARPEKDRASTGGDMWVQEWPDYPPRPQVEAGYRTLVERGVAMHVVYTGSWAEEYNYERQFLDMYAGVDFGDLVTLRHLPSAAHTLPDPVNREDVVRGVCSWITDVFSAPA